MQRLNKLFFVFFLIGCISIESLGQNNLGGFFQVQCGENYSSGFLFESDGKLGVLTSFHGVIKSYDGTNISAISYDKNSRTNQALDFRVYSFDAKNDVAFLVPISTNIRLSNVNPYKISTQSITECSTLTAYACPLGSKNVEISSLCLSSKKKLSFRQWIEHHRVLLANPEEHVGRDYQNHPLKSTELFDFTDNKKVGKSWSGGAILNGNGELVSIVNGGLQHTIVPAIFGTDLTTLGLQKLNNIDYKYYYDKYYEYNFRFSEREGEEPINYEKLSRLIIDTIYSNSKKRVRLREYWKHIQYYTNKENRPDSIVLDINDKYKSDNGRDPYVEFSYAMEKKLGLRISDKIKVGLVLRKNLADEIELYAELYFDNAQYLLGNFMNSHEVEIFQTEEKDGKKSWFHEGYLLEVMKYKYSDGNGNNCKLIILDINAKQINDNQVVVYINKSGEAISRIRYPECRYEDLAFDKYIK